MNDRDDNSPPFAVIFDMDGVLVDSADAQWESWRLLAEENGRAVTRGQFASTFGRQNRDIIPILFGGVSPQRLLALSERKEFLYRDLIRAQPPIVAGAVDLVQSLQAAGIRLAIGSSGPRANIDLVLAAMGVADAIAVIVSADDVTRGKPDPQVFQLAAERLGISSQRCIVIEDAPAGVAAARAAGARSVAVLRHHSREEFRDADWVVESLSDLSVHGLRAIAGA
jgi:beta-phosphoglucomutase